jgi:hypothetical protein
MQKWWIQTWNTSTGTKESFDVSTVYETSLMLRYPGFALGLEMQKRPGNRLAGLGKRTSFITRSNRTPVTAQRVA